MNASEKHWFWFRKAAVILVVFQAVYLVYSFHKVSTDYDFTMAYDNDAAKAMDIVGDTEWYLDTGYKTYGPLLYRLSRTIQRLTPNVFFKQTSLRSATEAHIHFALLVVNLGSVYLIAFLIVRQFSKQKATTLFFMVLLVSTLFLNRTWGRFLLRAYPETLLAALIALATSHLMSFSRNRPGGGHENMPDWLVAYKDEIIQGVLWTLALLTKRSAVPFAFGAFAGIICVRKDRKLQSAAFFVVSGTISYLIIGMPESWRFDRILGVGSRIEPYMLPFSWTYVLSFLQELMRQSYRPATLVLLMLFANPPQFMSHSKNNPYISPIVCGCVFFTGLFFFLYKQVSMANAHYAMILTVLLLILLVAALRRPVGKIGNWVCTVCRSGIGHLGLDVTPGHIQKMFWLPMFVAASTVGFFPLRPLEKAIAVQAMAPEIIGIQQMIRDTVESGKRVLQDPYTPTVWDKEVRGNVSIFWFSNEESIEEDTALVVLSREFYSRFLDNEPSPWIQSSFARAQKTMPDKNLSYPKSHRFYSILKQGETYQDRFGRQWVKCEFSSSNDFEVWQLQPK